MDRAIPDFVADERHRRTPRRLTVLTPWGPFPLAYRRTRWEAVDYEIKTHRIKEVFAWIGSQRDPAGAIKITGYDYRGLDAEDMVDGFDAYDAQAYTVAQVVYTSVDDPITDVFGHGCVVTIEGVWMIDRDSPPLLWSEAIAALIRQEFNGCAMILAKPFPLEFEDPDKEQDTERFLWRQKAMRRLYGRLGGLTGLPGQHGDGGWIGRHMYYATVPAPETAKEFA